MTEKKMAELAALSICKNWSFEQLKYSDYLYGKEALAHDVWDLVEEAREIGMIRFNQKYELEQS